MMDKRLNLRYYIKNLNLRYMKNFLFSISEIGGQAPDFSIENSIKTDIPDKKIINEVETPYNYKKERNDLKKLFLSFKSDMNFFILLKAPIYSN